MKHFRRTTKRLVVRPFELRDFKEWQRANLEMSPAKNKWDLGARPVEQLKKSDFKKLLASQKKQRAKDVFYDLGVFDKKGRYGGGVALMEVSRGISQTCFLGYRIFNGHWGQGYAKEAVKAIIDIGFKDLKLHRIEAGIEPGNIRSIRLAKSLHMRREGLKKHAIYLRKTWVDLIMYTLTTEDMGYKFDASKAVWKRRS